MRRQTKLLYRSRLSVRLLFGIIITLIIIGSSCYCHGLSQQQRPQQKVSSSSNSSNNKKTKNVVRVQVCQNKDCCQRFTGRALNLVETFQHIVPVAAPAQQQQDAAPPIIDIEVETSSCLSQCGKGPNVCITTTVNNDNNGNGKKRDDIEEEMYFGNVVDVTSAAAVLEMAVTKAGSDDTDIVVVHPTLVAAVNVMERAAKAASLEERERCLTSVISALQKKPELQSCLAMAYACAMRAQVRLERRREIGVDDDNYEQAMNDALIAINLDPTMDKAWRCLADVQEATGNIKDAITTLRQWSTARPSFATKTSREIQRLKELL